MGTAIGHGLARERGPRGIVFSERSATRSEELQRQGFGILQGSARDVAAEAVFVAVKAKDVPGVLEAISTQVTAGTPVISVAAGLDQKRILTALGGAYPVFRARPNILVREGRGNVLLQSDHGMEAASLGRVQALLSALGELYLCDERLMELRTWESSSVPLVVIPELLRRQLLRIGDDSERRQAGGLVLRALEALIDLAKGDPGGDLPQYLLRIRSDVAPEGGLNGAALHCLLQEGFWESLERAALCYRQREGELCEAGLE
jgi:pyrroline-5-carboxylate reductase